MAFCGKCGSQLSDGAPFCGKCGSPIGATAPAAPTPAPAAPPVQPQPQAYVPKQSPKTPTCKQCGSPYAEGARSCPKCGAGTVSFKDAYLATNTKKGGFGLLDMIPGVRDLPTAAKVFLVILLMVAGGALGWFGYRMLNSSNPSKAIQMVKTGHFNSHPEKTIGEAVDGFFGKPEWSSGIGKDGPTKGKMLANCRGVISYENQPANALIQFVVDEKSGNLTLRAFEVNGTAQNQMMIAALVDKMCERQETPATPAPKAPSPPAPAQTQEAPPPSAPAPAQESAPPPTPAPAQPAPAPSAVAPAKETPPPTTPSPAPPPVAAPTGPATMALDLQIEAPGTVLVIKVDGEKLVEDPIKFMGTPIRMQRNLQIPAGLHHIRIAIWRQPQEPAATEWDYSFNPGSKTSFRVRVDSTWRITVFQGQ